MALVKDTLLLSLKVGNGRSMLAVAVTVLGYNLVGLTCSAYGQTPNMDVLESSIYPLSLMLVFVTDMHMKSGLGCHIHSATQKPGIYDASHMKFEDLLSSTLANK